MCVALEAYLPVCVCALCELFIVSTGFFIVVVASAANLCIALGEQKSQSLRFS